MVRVYVCFNLVPFPNIEDITSLGFLDSVRIFLKNIFIFTNNIKIDSVIEKVIQQIQDQVSNLGLIHLLNGFCDEYYCRHTFTILMNMTQKPDLDTIINISRNILGKIFQKISETCMVNKMYGLDNGSLFIVCSPIDMVVVVEDREVESCEHVRVIQYVRSFDNVRGQVFILHVPDVEKCFFKCRLRELICCCLDLRSIVLALRNIIPLLDTDPLLLLTHVHSRNQYKSCMYKRSRISKLTSSLASVSNLLNLYGILKKRADFITLITALRSYLEFLEYLDKVHIFITPATNVLAQIAFLLSEQYTNNCVLINTLARFLSSTLDECRSVLRQLIDALERCARRFNELIVQTQLFIAIITLIVTISLNVIHIFYSIF